MLSHPHITATKSDIPIKMCLKSVNKLFIKHFVQLTLEQFQLVFLSLSVHALQPLNLTVAISLNVSLSLRGKQASLLVGSLVLSSCNMTTNIWPSTRSSLQCRFDKGSIRWQMLTMSLASTSQHSSFGSHVVFLFKLLHVYLPNHMFLPEF